MIHKDSNKKISNQLIFSTLSINTTILCSYNQLLMMMTGVDCVVDSCNHTWPTISYHSVVQSALDTITLIQKRNRAFVVSIN